METPERIRRRRTAKAPETKEGRKERKEKFRGKEKDVLAVCCCILRVRRAH